MTQQVIDILKQKKEVSFRPKGNSMLPYIKSGQLVTVKVVDEELQTGDIVFCRVKGVNYVHIIKSVKDSRYLISNAAGKENGYASEIYGKVVAINN